MKTKALVYFPLTQVTSRLRERTDGWCEIDTGPDHYDHRARPGGFATGSLRDDGTKKLLQK
jgi:hypothetical protein